MSATIVDHFLINLYSPILLIILPVLITNMSYSFFMAGLIVTTYNFTSFLVQQFFGFIVIEPGRGQTSPYVFCFHVLADNYLARKARFLPVSLGHTPKKPEDDSLKIFLGGDLLKECGKSMKRNNKAIPASIRVSVVPFFSTT